MGHCFSLGEIKKQYPVLQLRTPCGKKTLASTQLKKARTNETVTNDDKVPLLTDIDYLIEKKTYKQIQIPGVARLNCNHPHAWDNEKYEKLIQVTFESQSISIYGF